MAGITRRLQVHYHVGVSLCFAWLCSHAHGLYLCKRGRVATTSYNGMSCFTHGFILREESHTHDTGRSQAMPLMTFSMQHGKTFEEAANA